jgi:uncharacterized protein YbjT (DUF2867 family)
MILVTGATGTNGRLVVQALLAAGVRVRAIVQEASRATDLERAGAELVVADFDRPDTLDRALAGMERSLLLSTLDPRLVERETRFGERAKRAGVEHLVKFSAIGAHLAASFPFGRQHGAAERMIVDSGVGFTFVQPNFFMQNLLWSAEGIKTRGELASSIGSTPVSHVAACDIAAVIAATLTEPLDRHAGRLHLVTGPAAISFEQVAETFSRVPIEARSVPEPSRRAARGRAPDGRAGSMAGDCAGRAEHLCPAGARLRRDRYRRADHGTTGKTLRAVAPRQRRGIPRVTAEDRTSQLRMYAMRAAAVMQTPS